MKKEFKVKAKVWIYPGLGGWHFITLDKKLSASIKRTAKTYGSGFVKAEAKVGKTVWQTALFPHTKSGTYLLSIKKLVRKKEGILSDDEITVSVKIL